MDDNSEWKKAIKSEYGIKNKGEQKMKEKMKLKEDIDVRQATDRLLELVDSGALPAEDVLLAALKYMSEEQVAEMAEANGFFEEQETEVDENLLREAFEAGYKAARKLN